jgi:cytochrome d ubiquinol oxidase subunit II
MMQQHKGTCCFLGGGRGCRDRLSPVSLLTNISLVMGYALLGSTWLVMRTEGALQEHAFLYARTAGIATIVCVTRR